MFLISITGKVFSQTNTSNLYLKNIAFVDCRTLEFDIWLEWTGTNTQKLAFFQAGINFNYTGLANGGTLTGAVITGTPDASLPVVQQNPNWSINQTSKQIRMTAAIATPVQTAVATPPPPGYRLGRFRLTNTVDFVAGTTPNFAFNFAVGTASTTQTKVAWYLGSSTTATDVTASNTQFIESNPAFNLTCGVTCAVTATTDLATAPTCLGGNNGSVRVTLAGTGVTSTGTYSLDNGAAVAYTTNPFVITGLSAGAHTVSAITATPCTTNTAQFTIAAGADPNDGNACTTDACTTQSGVTHTPVNVDDGNICTTDACNTSTGAITHLPFSTDDGNACTTDGCNSNTGVFHDPVVITDNNACTTDACNTSTGAITHIAIPVDDGNACTTDACNSTTGAITHTAVPVDDGNACTTDACNTSTGAVTHVAVTTDDGNSCTTDGCNTSTGVFHTPTPTDDGNACTTDGCNSSTGGVFHTPVTTDDGNACTTDGCNTSTGVFHTPTPTDDNNACTTDGCNSATGGVFHTAVNTDDANVCTTDGCNTSTGVFHNPVSTTDNNACTTDGCNSITGVFHTPVDVNDNNACTTDACNTSTGAITHVAVVTDDNNACTVDACNSTTGAITHTAVNTDDGNICTTDGCNTSTGVFHTPVATDDGNACTTDGCNTTTGVFHTPVTVTDNNACTTDACNSTTGAITHIAVSVDDANACTTDGCNTVSGVFHTPVDVNDNNACTTDACNSTTGAITHTSVDVNDNNLCTTDACNSTTGAITHVQVNTDDGNACTTDGCNSTTGVFHNPVVTTDNNACTDDACNSSTGAITHTPVNINDNDICTEDGCNSITGIFHNQIPGCSNICLNPPTAVANGPYTSCGNTLLNGSIGGSATSGTWSSPTGGSFLPSANVLNATYVPTQQDLTNGSVILTLTSNNPVGAPCSTAVATATINFTSVDDGNACTIDGCNSTTGQITHTYVVIYDNNACTIDACNPVTGGITHVPIDANDNNPCTFDGCNTATGGFNIPINPDDGNLCTTDGCNSATGGIFHTPVDVNDNDPCTNDACNSITGAITHINDIPVVSTTPGNILCYGGSTCVTVSAVGGVSPYLGVGSQCGYTAGTFTFDVTDARGCTGTSQPVALLEPEKLVVSTSSNPSDCSANTGTATAFPSGGTPGYSYLWSPGGQTTNPATSLSSGNYTVLVTDANGCTASQLTAVGSTGNTPAPPTFISGPAGVCKKQNGVLFCVFPEPGAVYNWTLPTGITAVGQATGPCISVKVSTKFKGGFICVRVNNACGTSSLSCKNVVMIKKKPKTPLDINGSVSLCPSTDGSYSIAPVAGASGYIWSGQNGLQIISGQGTTSVVVRAPAGFNGGDLKVKASNCAGNSGERKLKLVTIPANPGGIQGQDNVCKSTNQSYSINQVNGANTYLWAATNGVVVISGQGTNSVVLRFTGATQNTTQISVIAQNSCGNSNIKTKNININSNCRTAIDVAGSGNETMLSELNAYPNPTSGKITLTFNSSSSAKYSITVTDLIGKTMMRNDINVPEGFNSKDLNLENLSKGVYLVTVQTEGEQSRTIRVVVE